MTYEKKAEIFEKFLQQTGSVVEALRLTEHEARRHLITSTVAAMRAQRAAGAKLSAIADDFGVTLSCAHYHCRGIVRGVEQIKPPAVAADLLKLVGAELGLPTDWHRNRSRGKPTHDRILARRAAMLALRAAHVSPPEIAVAFDIVVWKVRDSLKAADLDGRARDLAQAVVALAQAGALTAPTAVPPQNQAA